MTSNDFAAFILTNGRPDRVYTYKTLRDGGYTGPIYLLVDDLDKTADKYRAKYGDKVVIFDKKAIAAKFDQGDNFNDMRAIIYARNASFEVAEQLGVKYFIQLDDDYTRFDYRFDDRLDYVAQGRKITRLDDVFAAMLEFYKTSGADSIAFAQGGDFIGGAEGVFAQQVTMRRKCMNSFICSTERPFQFVGRVNEDVNTYTHKASTGMLFFTANQVSLNQKQTQSNSGGMTEMYLDSGTYVKTFYSVMYQPSSVKVSVMNSSHPRIHHEIRWRNTVPQILSEVFKKNY